MNISTFSPILVVLYVAVLLWILMDIHFWNLSRIQKWVIPTLIVFIAVLNHGLKLQLGAEAYGPLILFTMHIPFFFIFLHLTKCGIFKMFFMIFSAVAFMAPTILIGNAVKKLLGSQNHWVLLLANLLTYVIMLLLAQFVFRKGFNYLIKQGDRRSILLFSLIPLLYFVYLFAAMNLDFSGFNTVAGYIVRFLPTLFVFGFYFLVLSVYQEISQKSTSDIASVALKQKLSAAENQIQMLNKAQTQTAVYQHEMRHHLTLINGFLSAGKPDQAAEYVRKVQEDVEAIIPKRFCENETVNLLCSSFCEKADRLGIRMNVQARVQQDLPIPDMELCSVISNGLENAIHAVANLEESWKWVEFYSEVRNNNLLIEIKNPYAGVIRMGDGLPISAVENHGYGCSTIRAIAQYHRGHCLFEPKNGVFTLQVVLPLR